MGAPQKAMRKAVDQPLELYDLQTDPGEKQNVVAQIEDYLKRARTESPIWRLEPPKARKATQ